MIVSIWMWEPIKKGYIQKQILELAFWLYSYQYADLEEAGGSDPPPHTPWKITQIWGFFAILVRIPLKITKLPSQHSMMGHHRHASETPFKWRFTGGPMMARSQWYLDHSVPPTNWKKAPKKERKNVIKVRPPSDKTFWIRAWYLNRWLFEVEIQTCLCISWEVSFTTENFCTVHPAAILVVTSRWSTASIQHKMKNNLAASYATISHCKVNGLPAKYQQTH